MTQQQQTYTYAPFVNNPAGTAPQGYSLYHEPRPVYQQPQEQPPQNYQLPPEYRYTTQPVYQNPVNTGNSPQIRYVLSMHIIGSQHSNLLWKSASPIYPTDKHATIQGFL
jgi:hypothetical protein